VHCAAFFLEPARPAEKGVGAGKDRAPSKAKAPSHLITSAERGRLPAVLLGAWMPGQKAAALPDRVAWLLPAGSRIRLEVHYRGAGEQSGDRSALGLHIASAAPGKQARHLSIDDPALELPAGAGLHRVSRSVVIQEDSEAVAVRPSAHPLLVSLQASAHRPDGTQEVLVWTRGYQFDWQPAYYFRRPVALPKGTRIEVVAHFDNSDSNPKNPNNPPARVRWADHSSGALCSLIIAGNRGE
jgi:hypothetical protein